MSRNTDIMPNLVESRVYKYDRRGGINELV